MRSSFSYPYDRRSNLVGHSDKLLLQAFSRLDAKALGIAVGVWAGLVVFFATVWLLVKDGSSAGRNLELLAQYFVGYRVTWTGSLIGFAYGFVSGFCAGWLIAFLRNLYLSLYLRVIRLRSYMSSLTDL